GNTKSPISRNLLASLGLGAPMHGKRGDLIFADVKRQTDLSEKIAPPKYPFRIDNDAAKRGAPLFEQNCNSCHGGPESDKRLFDEKEMGYTDDGDYLLDTACNGNSNSGHDYGTKLSENEKRDLIEYLKTL